MAKRKTKSVLKTPKKTQKQSHFKNSLEHIKENQKFIYFIVAVFLFSGVISFISHADFAFFNEMLEGLKDKTEGLGFLGITWFIFQNNALAALSGMLLGMLLGVYPLFAALFNGLLVGYVFKLASDVGGYGVIWMLVPHGIFELPAVFIALGLGLAMGWLLLSGFFSFYLAKRKFFLVSLGVLFPLITIFAAFIFDRNLRNVYSPSFKQIVSKSLIAFLLVVLPLLIVAAVIEGALITFS